MNVQDLANELWGAVIYDVHMDLLRHNFTYFVRLIQGNETVFYEIHFKKIYLFKYSNTSPEPWDYVELVSIDICKKEDKYCVEMELWLGGATINIECDDISISKKEY